MKKDLLKGWFTFVMPMIINHRDKKGNPAKYDQQVEDNDLERIIKIQLPTFKKFLNLDDLLEFIIISRKIDIPIIKERLNREFPEFPFVYYDEADLLPELESHKVRLGMMWHPGWIIQQLAKLEISKYVKTEVYFSFETDLFLTKPFGMEQLYNGDKLICSYFTKYKDTPTRESWHIQSTNVLYNIDTIEAEGLILDEKTQNRKEDKILYINKVMGVSPQVLVTNEVKGLIEFIEKRYNNNYKHVLMAHTGGHPTTWTEYSLYWLWLHKQDKLDDYYSFEPPFICSTELLTSNYKKGFDKEYFDNFDELVINNKNHYFNIIQSNISQISLDYIASKLKKHIK